MSSPSPDSAQPRRALILCGALSADASAWIAESGVEVAIHPLPPLLHNRPERIAPEVEQVITTLRGTYDEIAIGYADCGSYDVYAGESEMTAIWTAEPGTYVLTDFLVLSFDRLVWRELGLDRHPELLDDYFRHYSRVVWLAGRRTPDMERAAQRAADRLGLPLDIIAAPGRLTQTLDNLFTP